jgi:hypothetical protein
VDFAREFVDHLARQGYGRGGHPAHAPARFLSRLRGLSRAVGVRVCPATLHDTDGVLRLAAAARTARTERTVQGYVSAMTQYVGMVQTLNLWEEADAEPSPGATRGR